jgi:hypothetical protein
LIVSVFVGNNHAASKTFNWNNHVCLILSNYNILILFKFKSIFLYLSIYICHIM